MIYQKIRTIFSDALKEVGLASISASELVIEIPKNALFGDYAVGCQAWQKILKKSPLEIAQKIAQTISEKQDFIEATACAPGFVNLKLAHHFLISILDEILTQKDQYGHLDYSKDFKVNIEFVSANPTGPLTVGNGRGGFCGDALANVFAISGSKVEREYYVNDRGVQIEALGHSVLKDTQAVYSGKYIDNLNKKVVSRKPASTARFDARRVGGLKVEDIGQWAAKEILENSIKKTLEKMGIKMNRFFSEYSLYTSREVEQILKLLEDKKYVLVRDGAVWFKSDKSVDEKDRVLKKQNGDFTYFASDIAYHADKIRRGYDLCINFWGADHAGYVPRIESAINDVIKNELNWSGKFKVIIFQLVKLIKNGKEFRMSKRAGNAVYMDDFLKEVSVDAARFFFLMHSYNTHMNFDLDLAKKQSKENPVYYVQYAHARIASILRKVGNRSSLTSGKEKVNFALLTHPAELKLIMVLTKLPDLVEEITMSYQVHKLPFYALSIADAFHNFYENCQVIDEGNDLLTDARIELCNATKIVLKNTLSLMGIQAPSKM